MAVPKETRWRIEPHTQIKHLILRRYLQAWLPITAKHNGRIIFVDGFAGPGRYTGGEEGSPLIALRALLDHPHFRQRRPGREILLVFIEREEDRAVALREEISSFRTKWPIPNWAKVRVQQGEFAPLINQVLELVSKMVLWQREEKKEACEEKRLRETEEDLAI